LRALRIARLTGVALRRSAVALRLLTIALLLAVPLLRLLAVTLLRLLAVALLRLALLRLTVALLRLALLGLTVALRRALVSTTAALARGPSVSTLLAHARRHITGVDGDETVASPHRTRQVRLETFVLCGIFFGSAACVNADPGSGEAGGGDGGSPGVTQGAGGAPGEQGGADGEGGDAVLGTELCPDDAGIAEGFDVGQRLGGIEVRRCSGEVVSLDAFCGAQALWIFAAHGWCPLCQSVSSEQESIQQEYAAQGLVSVNIVVADGLDDPPDAAYCDLWRSEHGHAEVVTLYDPTGSVLALWPGGSSSLSAFVDADRVIRAKLVHESSVAKIRAELDAALAGE
jgi:hypothetical protein